MEVIDWALSVNNGKYSILQFDQPKKTVPVVKGLKER